MQVQVNAADLALIVTHQLVLRRRTNSKDLELSKRRDRDPLFSWYALHKQSIKNRVVVVPSSNGGAKHIGNVSPRFLRKIERSAGRALRLPT